VNDDEQDNYGEGQGGRGQFLAMVGLVALSVAVTILVFFGVGYAFGRLFL
jgi:hypothetical protein